jgi:hypothetical protein
MVPSGCVDCPKYEIVGGVVSWAVVVEAVTVMFEPEVVVCVVCVFVSDVPAPDWVLDVVLVAVEVVVVVVVPLALVCGS